MSLSPPSWVENIQSHQTGWHAWYWYHFARNVDRNIDPRPNVGQFQQYQGCLHSIEDCILVIWKSSNQSIKEHVVYVPIHFLKYHHEELNCIACYAANKWWMHIAGLTRVCAACCTGLVPLPCAVCNRPLECWGGDTLEMYILSEESRFLCCGADAHQLCRMQFLAKDWQRLSLRQVVAGRGESGNLAT